MMTRRDPYVNILRTTIAVFAAAPRRRRRDHRAAVHRRARTARPLCAPHRAQHAARPAGGVEPRQGRRSGRRLRRVEDLTDQLCRRGLDAVSGDRSGGRRRRSARERPHSAQGRRRPRRSAQRRVARREDALTGVSMFPDPRRSRTSRCSRQCRRRPAAPGRSKRSSRCRRSASPSRSKRCATHPTGCLRGPARGRRSSSPISARPRTSPRAQPSPRISSKPAASRR